MKKNDIITLRGKSITDLQSMLTNTEKELAKTQLELSMAKHTNKHAAKIVRRKVAVMKTLIREKELAGNA